MGRRKGGRHGRQRSWAIQCGDRHRSRMGMPSIAEYRVYKLGVSFLPPRASSQATESRDVVA